VIQVGYRPYPALRAALARIAPALVPLHPVDHPATYAAYWQGVTAREAAEALGVTTEAVEPALADAVAAGTLTRRGWIYAPAQSSSPASPA
jgi:DNA-directed RNA polymerase specialized sigma24 family protein